MRSKKLPALHFYPGDWKKDAGVQSLDFAQRGVWFEIILLMFESTERGVLLLNHKPMTDDQLSRVLGLDKQNLSKYLEVLLDTGVADRREDGALICRRMVREEALSLIRAECGSKGGNPKLLKQNGSKKPIVAKPKQQPNAEDEVVIEDEVEDEILDPKKASTGAAQKPPAAAPRPEADPPPPEFGEFADEALAALQPIDDPGHQADSRFINAGWRPLKKYPLLWFNTVTLCETMEAIEAAGVPRKDFRLVWRHTNVWVEKLKANGDDVKRISGAELVNRFGIKAALTEIAARDNAKRAELYRQRAETV